MDKKKLLIASLAALVALGGSFKAGEMLEGTRTAAYKQQANETRRALETARKALFDAKTSYNKKLIQELKDELKNNPELAERIDTEIQRALFNASYVSFEHQMLRNLVRGEADKNPALRTKMRKLLPDFKLENERIPRR